MTAARGSTTITLDEIERVRAEAQAELAAIVDESSAGQFRIKYLGKKGIARELLKHLKNVPADERKVFGERVNGLHEFLKNEFEKKTTRKGTVAPSACAVDYTLSGVPFPRGSLHPLMRIRNEIRDIFTGMGFTVEYGPEVETDYYNFEALNTPAHHPARDMQDTFYIDETTLLRTQTSPVQIRVMEQRKPPIRSIMPGRVYRNEEISARSFCLFHQVEGLYVDENVSFADLKGTLLAFAKCFFDPDTRLKIRPSFFPFTEPSVEIDVACFLCKGTGCSICKRSGWLEILGAGMVHPNVLKNCGIDSERHTGFAFGMGIERIAMLKYGINDIRLFFENDVRFLRQF
ncbi:MAG: phenylalanine--tRNA ligase subunit alpha [Chitinispirillaceae bacterium]|nr:phenylalanine--tRNA ligase subunit alpha [Chitinispirillaceae bacterium]